MTDHPSDDGARSRILGDLDSTLFVEAGAGTGKTTQLVGRIVTLVTAGRARIDEIAAITFTEPAAGELRERLAELLEQVAQGRWNPNEPALAALESFDEARRGDASKRAREAIESLESAAVTTLHGFARRILADHALEAGLPPGFEVVDDTRSSVDFQEAWRGFSGALVENSIFRTALHRAIVCGVSVEHLAQVARRFSESWDLLEDTVPGEVSQRPFDLGALLEPLERAQQLAGFCTCAEDKLRVHLENIAGHVARMRMIVDSGSQGIDALMLVLHGPKNLSCPYGQKANWSGRIDEVRSLLREASNARDELKDRVASDALAALMVPVRDFVLECAELRRLEGRLDFHDLLVLARRLVRGSSSVRAQLHEQFRYILVDEFQDTDPIQAELALRIAAGGEQPPSRAWRDLPIEEGRLFFVGDPKQSIYRFRRADIGLYMTVGGLFTPGNQLLTRNHRSVPGILDWVNGVFSRLMGDGEEQSQPPYVSLGATRDGHRSTHGQPAVTLLGEESKDRIGEIRAREAGDIADLVSSVVGSWPVGDEERPARLGDICILIPRRAALSSLTWALDDAEIPYHLESGHLVYASEEVRQLLAVLRAIDDPTDAVAVVAALRSDAFACDDSELLRYRLEVGSWDYRDGATGASSGRVRRSMEKLEALHRLRFWCEPAALVEKVVDECRLRESALDGGRHRDVWRRLDFVIDQARLYSADFGGGLRAYLRWAESQAEDGTRVEMPVLPERDHDALRIMTIHKAKGLEFPVVILAGLNGMRGGGRGPTVLWGESGPEVKVNALVKTHGYEFLAKLEQKHEEHEDLRMLYVGATRARDHLVVSLHRSGKSSLAARLAPVCDEVPELWQAWSSGAPRVRTQVGPPVELPADVFDDPRSRLDWIARRDSRMNQARTSKVVAPTTIAHLVADEQGGGSQDPGIRRLSARDEGSTDRRAVDQVDSGHRIGRRGRAGTAVGRAVHAVLQLVDMATGEGLDEIAASQARLEGVPASRAEIARLARAALGSPVIRDALSHPYWREIYVGVPVSGRVLEGFIDLLVQGEDGFEIVDYKTDVLAGEDDLDRALRRYRPQGAAYAVAVETVTGRPVSECSFVFLRGKEAVVARIDDLDAAKDEVRGLLAAL